MKKETIFICGMVVLLVLIIYGILEMACAILVYLRGDYLKTLDPAYYRAAVLKDRPVAVDKHPLYRCDPSIGIFYTANVHGTNRGGSYPRAEFRVPFVTNAEGFRSSRDYNHWKGAKVAVLGDSFVNAIQVREEDSFPMVVERKLQAAGRDIAVFNYGVMMTGTIHHYKLFEKMVLPLNPEIVVEAFYINDLTDDSSAYANPLSYFLPQYRWLPSGEIEIDDFNCQKRPLATKKGIVLSGDNQMWHLIQKQTELLDKARFSLSLRYLSAWLKDVFLLQHECDPTFDIHKKVYPPELEESLKVTVSLLDQMHRTCQAKGIDFMVLLIPSALQVYPEQWRAYVRGRKPAVSAETFDLDNPQQKLTAELSARGIPFLDLMSEFRRQSKKEKFYYTQDAHFNVDGHRLAGEVLAEELSKLLEGKK